MKKESKLERFRKLSAHKSKRRDDCIRPEKEDDDGYDPYSDRKPEEEQLFESQPWS